VLIPEPLSGTRADRARIERLARIERDGGDGHVPAGRGALRVTSLHKTYFPDAGYTKGDVMRYYVAVAPLLLPRLRGRPLSLKRFPDGIAGDGFFQQKAQEPAPAGVRVEPLPSGAEAGEPRYVGGSLATLLHLVQLGTISMDPWHSRIGALDRADYAVLDLDPGDETPFAVVVEVAREAKRQMDAMRLDGEPKTSGATGMHIVLRVPRGATPARARKIAGALAARVADARPDVATLERAIDARPAGSVYLDFMQNDLGKTVAAPYSVRPRPGATVSTPLRWDELTPTLDPRRFTIATVLERFRALGAG
jgi:bifunctional non-homologous end joining protein LigD